MLFFFFQAEDGIRDYKVTGVQTCALPILTERVAVIAVEGHAPPVVGPHRAAVNEGPVGELAHAAAAVVVQLRILIASLILQEHEAAAATRRARPLDRILVEGELLTHAERGGNAVQLLAVAEARRDEQAPVGEPVEEARLPRLLVALEPRHERRIRERNALERSEERRVGKECRSRWSPYH